MKLKCWKTWLGRQGLADKTYQISHELYFGLFRPPPVYCTSHTIFTLRSGKWFTLNLPKTLWYFNRNPSIHNMNFILILNHLFPIKFYSFNASCKWKYQLYNIYFNHIFQNFAINTENRHDTAKKDLQGYLIYWRWNRSMHFYAHMWISRPMKNFTRYIYLQRNIFFYLKFYFIP